MCKFKPNQGNSEPRQRHFMSGGGSSPHSPGFTRAGRGQAVPTPAGHLAAWGLAFGLRGRRARLHGNPAFTRVDLLCLIAVAAFLLGWAGFMFTGERYRIARCAGNLKALGHAMGEYASDHDGGIPVAVIDLPKARVSWDSELFAYLEPALAKTPGAFAKRELSAQVAPVFVCPSDSLVRPHPRSYVMPANDMSPANWPPGADSATGTGLMWNRQTVTNLLAEDEAEKAMQNPGLLPQVKLAELPAPADTLLLTELIVKGNTLKSTSPARVTLAGQQQALTNANMSQFHLGKVNYLMADGHVEWLSPSLTGNAGMADADQPSGIWTMKGGD